MAKPRSTVTKPNSKRSLIDKSKSVNFAALAIASVVVSFSFVTTKFLWDRYNFNTRVIDKKEEARNKLEQNVENVAELQKSFRVLENEEDGITSREILDALPSKYDFPALASSIEKLADTGDYRLILFSGTDDILDVEQTSTVPVPTEINFTFAVQGRYVDIQAFVDQLRLSIRPFKINGIELEGSDDDLKATFQVTTYYQPAESLEINKETVR